MVGTLCSALVISSPAAGAQLHWGDDVSVRWASTAAAKSAASRNFRPRAVHISLFRKDSGRRAELLSQFMNVADTGAAVVPLPSAGRGGGGDGRCWVVVQPSDGAGFASQSDEFCVADRTQHAINVQQPRVRSSKRTGSRSLVVEWSHGGLPPTVAVCLERTCGCAGTDDDCDFNDRKETCSLPQVVMERRQPNNGKAVLPLPDDVAACGGYVVKVWAEAGRNGTQQKFFGSSPTFAIPLAEPKYIDHQRAEEPTICILSDMPATSSAGDSLEMEWTVVGSVSAVRAEIYTCTGGHPVHAVRMDNTGKGKIKLPKTLCCKQCRVRLVPVSKAACLCIAQAVRTEAFAVMPNTKLMDRDSSTLFDACQCCYPLPLAAEAVAPPPSRPQAPKPRPPSPRSILDFHDYSDLSSSGEQSPSALKPANARPASKPKACKQARAKDSKAQPEQEISEKPPAPSRQAKAKGKAVKEKAVKEKVVKEKVVKKPAVPEAPEERVAPKPEASKQTKAKGGMRKPSPYMEPQPGAHPVQLDEQQPSKQLQKQQEQQQVQLLQKLQQEQQQQQQQQQQYASLQQQEPARPLLDMALLGPSPLPRICSCLEHMLENGMAGIAGSALRRSRGADSSSAPVHSRFLAAIASGNVIDLTATDIDLQAPNAIDHSRPVAVLM